jgi:hypothetical protein
MKTLPKLMLLLALTAPAALAQAQPSRGVLGKVDSVMLDDQVIVIDGKRLVVREAELVVTYKGRPVRATFVAEGLSISYSTREDGSVSEITLVGPADVLEQIDNQ